VKFIKAFFGDFLEVVDNDVCGLVDVFIEGFHYFVFCLKNWEKAFVSRNY
jgi:hypothetical protein